MKFILHIECNNDVFNDEAGNWKPANEVAIVLRNLADKITDRLDIYKMHDSNGNGIGFAQFMED